MTAAKDKDDAGSGAAVTGRSATQGKGGARGKAKAAAGAATKGAAKLATQEAVDPSTKGAPSPATKEAVDAGTKAATKATRTRSGATLRQTPSQTVGPYFAYGLAPTQYGYGTGHSLPSLYDARIAGEAAAGEPIEIIGRVFDGDGKPIPDALIEILQADANGKYATDRSTVARTDFRGFGRVGTGTDREHRFRFESVKPGSIGPGHAPHLNVIVLMRGMLVHAFTRIYFDDEGANAEDPVLATVPAKRRATLIAKRAAPRGGRTVYRFDIRMQGDDETVFFDV